MIWESDMKTSRDHFRRVKEIWDHPVTGVVLVICVIALITIVFTGWMVESSDYHFTPGGRFDIN